MKKEIILFDKQKVKLEVSDDKNTWLTLDDIAILFERDKKTIGTYIKNILLEEAFLTNVTKYVKEEKSKKEICYYNIDVILSVGYRVKSEKGILFRKRANEIIKEKLLNDK